MMSQQANAHKHKIKILVIGSVEVGKTQLINRLCEKKFEQEYQPTLGIDFRIKYLDTENKQFILYLWDTSGQDRFQSVTDIYLNGSKIILFVFDLSKPDTLEYIKAQIEKVNNMNCNIHKILIGNKCDKEQSVQNDQINTLLQTEKIQYFEISTQENININNLQSYIQELVKNDYPSNDEIQKLSSIILQQNQSLKARDTCCHQCQLM